MRATIHTKSAEETTSFGEKLGKKLQPGDVIAMFGDLGAGKTTLTKGIALGLELSDDIHSPTFTLIHEHIGPTPLYHVDLYRLESEAEVDSLGIEEYIYADGVTVIEWADRMKSLLPTERLDIELKMEGDNNRRIILQTDSPRMQAIVEELTTSADSCH